MSHAQDTQFISFVQGASRDCLEAPMKIYSLDDAWEALTLECHIAGCPVPPEALAAYREMLAWLRQLAEQIARRSRL